MLFVLKLLFEVVFLRSPSIMYDIDMDEIALMIALLSGILHGDEQTRRSPEARGINPMQVKVLFSHFFSQQTRRRACRGAVVSHRRSLHRHSNR